MELIAQHGHIHPLAPTRRQATGIILAGGRSRRMGTDKALLLLPGQEHTTFIAHLASLLHQYCSEVVIVARSQEQIEQYIVADARCILDETPDIGPLMGLYTGLRATQSSAAFVTAVDTPYVQPALLSLLLTQLQLDQYMYVPVVNDVPQVLCAMYPRNVLPHVEARLQQGRRDPRSLLDIVEARYIEEAQLRTIDPQLRSFLNVNTPSDYSPLFDSI